VARRRLTDRIPRAALLPVAGLVAVVVLLKVWTLRTPAYWDEMAWVKQADWLSTTHLWRALPGLRPDSVFWGHPPGLHLTAAAAFKVFGSSVELAHLIILGFAALGVVSTFLLARLLYDATTAWVAALLLLLCPLYFAQAGMYLADVPVTALGVTCVYLALTRRYVPYLVCASYMVLLKETSVALVVALVIYLCVAADTRSKRQLVDALKYGAPLIVIGAFVLLQRITTGHFFAIYDYEFRLYDLSLGAVRRQFNLVTDWIFLNQSRWFLTIVIALDLLWFGVRERKDAWLFGLIVVLSGYPFAALYFLPRYLLPVLPFFFMMGANSLLRLLRAPRVRIAVAVAAVGAAAWVLATQPFVGNSEFNPRYLDAVKAHEAMANYIAANDPTATVLTLFPHVSELNAPLLGYVDHPIATKNFTKPADLDGSDLIIVSSQSSDPQKLKSLAQYNKWPVVHTVREGKVEMVLYAREGR
jgi:4-amino-4-deoxy-L-arabinose transferase-like glycosyltransferase